jgi:serine/threonine protein kinase
MTHLGSPLDYYDLIEQIGDGSFGTVHKAKHKTTKKLVNTKKNKEAMAYSLLKRI